MISAERFARERTSYWNQLLPRMEPFVRGMNLSAGRFSPPMGAAVVPERRALVAELAFELFRQRVANGRRGTDLEAAFSRVRSLIARLSSYAPDEVAPPSTVEGREARALATRLFDFVKERRAHSLTVDPNIPGCGIIDRAAADFLISRTPLSVSSRSSGEELLLYEVKTVDRPFRAGDLRQVLTYAALMAAVERQPAMVGLVNPRLGTYFDCAVDDLTMDVAGIPANELLQQIIFDVSAAEVSP